MTVVIKGSKGRGRHLICTAKQMADSSETIILGRLEAIMTSPSEHTRGYCWLCFKPTGAIMSFHSLHHIGHNSYLSLRHT